jgi:hypothetical protein
MRPTVKAVLALLLALLLALGLVAACSTEMPLGGSRDTGSPDSSRDSAAAPVKVTRAFFGVHDSDPLSWPAAPVGSLRVWDAGTAWNLIETSPGVFNFNRLDAIISTARANKADTLIVLGQTPTFHASNPDQQAPYGAGASSMPRLDAWRKYVQAIVLHAHAPDVEFQVWNEANVTNYWSGTPAQMAQLTAVARQVIDKIDPETTLVAPAFVTRFKSQRNWMDDFFAQKVDGKPVSDLIDVVSLQLYPLATTPTPEAAMAQLATDREILARRGVDKPVWNTESNYGSKGGKDVTPASPNVQVANVARTYLLDAAYGVRRVFWYAWDMRQPILDTFLVEADRATPTAAGRAFATVQSWMIGKTVTACEVDTSGTYTCTLVKGDDKSFVLWNSGRTVQVKVEANMTSAEKLTGERQPVTAGSQLTVDATPVLVRADRSTK